MTLLHLIRHGQTERATVAYDGRLPGAPLNAQGRRQADSLAGALAGLPLAAILASPFARAQETARPLAARLGLPVIEEPRLAEIDTGDWSGVRFDVLADDPQWQGFHRSRAFACPPGGESLLAVQARAIAALRDAAAQWPDREVAVFTHADIIRAVLAAALGMSIDLIDRIVVEPGSRSVVRMGAPPAVLGINLV